jgi:gas vesicle protein
LSGTGQFAKRYGEASNREDAMKRHTSATAEVVTFSAGAIIGAGLALLYAPKTGHEMREKVSDATEDAISKMKRLTVDAQETLNRNLQKGHDYAEEKVSEFSSAVEETKEELYH